MKNLDRFATLFDLSGRVAVVTGAAQGNGQAIANALACAGATVIAADLRFPKPEELDESIRCVTMDVTSEKAVAEIFSGLFKEYGSLDILVNNAGIIYKDPVESLDMARFNKTMQVNLNGVVICTKHAVPYMKKNRWGRIVNISSSQAFLASETYSAYSASKAAVSHLTRLWGEELAGDNIFVNALCPSYVMTPMAEAGIPAFAERNGVSWQEAHDWFVEKVPIKRFLSMDEVANWAVLLCSEMITATTGCNFAIAGGQVHL